MRRASGATLETMTAALLAASLWLSASAGAQPQPPEAKPAQTPEGLAKQIAAVTQYLVDVQRWKKNAASGKVSEDKRRRIRDAEAAYHQQHELLLELTSRLQLWAYIADNLDREHAALTDAEVSQMRRRELEAIGELHDRARASPAALRR